MIWYLLYPLRGTTEAPVLTPSHPLRRAFARYGAYATRHVITTLLISTAVAAVLIYPFPFLYTTDFTNGASNLPHHVWTLAQPIEKAAVEPDVVMRSVWVHGSYMQALDREVLLGALQLQDELLGPTENFDPRRPGQPAIEVRDHSLDMTPNDRDAFHVINGLTNQSWFFHSPLQYWYGSPERISSDADIISTVNERKSQPTSVNTTLRHSIVFSGKHFEDRRLLAADALVITLIHLRDSPVGRQWERKAAALATQMADKWTAYPADGSSMSNQLYEFQFQPMSIHDTIVLALAYGLSMLYFFVSMSKLRAVKSKTGLIVTVMTQIMLSILSSFTVCAVFKIDLSRIPQAAYPVVVLSMSLENIFRLINAVIATPSEHSTSSRIGHAFGDTAPIALASSLQNVLILWALSKVVSPGVSAFCTFAAVAIVFDFFYLSTFFLSVLGVDVRRTELSEALDKASSRVTRRPSESAARASWTDALLQGKIAMSTRIAGTIIMVGFVLAAQWHFFENQTILRVLGGLFRLSDTKSSLTQQKESFYIAQVYDPLVFVLKGADRTPRLPERPLLPALYDFIDHHLVRFVVTVILILAAVRLFMSYLLWKEDAEFKSGHDFDNEPLTSVTSLSKGHTLDVVLMAASVDGHIVSVGLDRSIRVWDVRAGQGQSPLVSVKPLTQSSMSDRGSPLSVLTASKKGCIHVANQQDQGWTSVSLDMHSLEDRDASQVVPLPGLDCFLVARQHSVDLVDGKAYRLLHVFETDPIQPQTLRAFHSARRKPQCGSVGLISFGLAYNDNNTGDCVIQTYLPKEDGDTICFRDSSAPASRSCCKWPDTMMSQRRINNPGTWEALSGGFIVGVRRDQPLPARYSPDSSPTTQGLRRRIYSFRQDDRPGLKLDKWEIWVASHSGRHDVYETMPLHSDDEMGGCLMISELGPMAKVGTASVVVGFGTILKLVTVGHEHFEDGHFAAKGQELLNIGSRRRKPGPGTFRARANVWDKSQ
ncbi:Sterol regulatory element-binding protein cleavage-activating like [Verticillium longisporum]|uniref:Sterol regulatory element-binding protein cleavage-activating like n=1 Tax=Verticillium longisporum TaxID=100787 RepID=A0A8I2ZG19_VERLO|nr:Sterol regulatory element-binding protein cleavage-activating like [Verticillium longisporum]